MVLPMTLSLLLTCFPMKIRATMATIAIRARISAYSARPCPSSSRRKEAMIACKNDMLEWDLLSSRLPVRSEGTAQYGWSLHAVKREAGVCVDATLREPPNQGQDKRRPPAPEGVRRSDVSVTDG